MKAETLIYRPNKVKIYPFLITHCVVLFNTYVTRGRIAVVTGLNRIRFFNNLESRFGFSQKLRMDFCFDKKDFLPTKKHHFSNVHRGLKFMYSDKSCVKISQNHTSNLDEVFLKPPPSSDFGLEPRILQIG